MVQTLLSARQPNHESNDVIKLLESAHVSIKTYTFMYIYIYMRLLGLGKCRWGVMGVTTRPVQHLHVVVDAVGVRKGLGVPSDEACTAVRPIN